MSSPTNQNMLASVNTGEFSNSRQGGGGGPFLTSNNNTIRAQRSQLDQKLTSKGIRSKQFNGRGKGRKNSARTKEDTLDSSGHNSGVNVQNLTSQIVESSSSTTTSNYNSGSRSGRIIGYKASKGGLAAGGKHRQRQNGNQLLENMSSTTGLDIDFAESILPTTSNTGRQAEAGKGGRYSTNNRKVNLTHLLNYRFECKERGGPRAHQHHQLSSSHANNPNFHYAGSQYRDHGTFHRFNKQQFLQANCQFVVLKGPDYSVHKVDPDWPVDWNFIEEIKFKQSSSTETTCPICLEPPIAAKITRCGHIYCWTCMLHYLSLSDDSSRQCPICFELVQKDELRSVVSHSFTSHSVGEEIVMKLMERKKGCVEVEPYRLDSSKSPAMNTDMSNDEPMPTRDERYFSSANLVIVDSAAVESKIVQRERRELLFKYEMDKDEPEVCFIEQALVELKKRIEKLQSTALQESIGLSQEPLHREQNSELSKSYLFYQCSDGQHIYLNPFSTKILCQEYDNLENCPLEIRANILQMDWISMSEAWRKRFRYLEHLPLTCEFRLIEIDFEHSKLVSPETYSMFADQIRRREQEREFRRREERRREKIIQVEQNRRIYGIQPSMKINLDSTDQFPSVSDERYLDIRQRRHQTRSTELVPTDEDSDEDNEVEPVESTSTTNASPATSKAAVSPELVNQAPKEALANVVLSFKDIQLQEAAKESNFSSSGPGQRAASKVWSSSSAQSSSFAQLLVNAKTSQKEWTRNSSNMNCSSTVNHIGKPCASKSGLVDEEDTGQTRAPPSDFTISDFIDLNVAASVGKKKGISKSGAKR